MGFVLRGETVTGAMSLDELKLVYRSLHKSLPQFPELMETEFLTELQTFLHREAAADGVDATDHGQWDAWLEGSPGRMRLASEV
jgi:hypothetical protein